MVTFNFPDGKSIRVPKNILSSESPVFEAMFGETWNKDTVEMRDLVDFDQYLIFKQFLFHLFDLEPTGLQTLRMGELMDYYFYANLYQTSELQKNILSRIERIVIFGSVAELKQCLQFASAYDISEFRSKVLESTLSPGYPISEFKLEEFNEYLAIEKELDVPGFTHNFIDSLLRRQPPHTTKELRNFLELAKGIDIVDFKSKIVKAYCEGVFYLGFDPDELRSFLLVVEEFDIASTRDMVLDKFIKARRRISSDDLRQYMTIASEFKLRSFMYKLTDGIAAGNEDIRMENLEAYLSIANDFQLEAFKGWIDVSFSSDRYKYLSMSDLKECMRLADKFSLAEFKEVIFENFVSRKSILSFRELREFFLVGRVYRLKHFKEILDDYVAIGIGRNDAVEIFKFVRLNGFAQIKDQVIKHFQGKSFDEHWPIDLMEEIHSQARSKITDCIQLLDYTIDSFDKYECNCWKDLKKVTKCSKCQKVFKRNPISEVDLNDISNAGHGKNSKKMKKAQIEFDEAKNSPFDSSWPLNLVKRIHERHIKIIEQFKSVFHCIMMRGLGYSDECSWLCNCFGVRKMASDCQNCYRMLSKSFDQFMEGDEYGRIDGKREICRQLRDVDNELRKEGLNKLVVKEVVDALVNDVEKILNSE